MITTWVESRGMALWQALAQRARARPWRLVLIIASIAVIAFQVYRLLAPQGCATLNQMCNADFHQYYNAALDIRRDVDPYLRALRFQGTTQSTYVYPPLFATLLTPLSLFSFPVAMTLWDVCNVLFLGVSIFALLRAAGWARPRLELVAVLTAVASPLGPVRSVLFWGQADLFILCCMSLSLLAASRRRLGVAGVLLAIACVIKPTYIALVVYLLWKREFKFAVVTGVAFVVLFLAPFAWLGGQSLHDELVTLNYLSSQYTFTLVNHAPKGVLQRLFTVNPFVRPLAVAPILVTLGWLATIVVVAVPTVALVVPQRLRAEAMSLLETGLAIVALFLVSPMTEEGHLVLLIVPLVALLAWLRGANLGDARFRQAAGAAVALVLVLELPLHGLEAALWVRMQHASWPLADLLMVLAAVYLYVMIAFFALQLRALSLAERRSLREAMRLTVTGGPRLLGAWIRDARDAAASLALPGGLAARLKVARETR